MAVWIGVAVTVVVLLGLAAYYDRRRRGHNAPGARRRHVHSDRQSSDAALQAQVHDIKNTFGPS